MVYMVGGCAYNRTVQHARGWRQLPNYNMWSSMAGFIRVRIVVSSKLHAVTFGSLCMGMGRLTALFLSILGHNCHPRLVMLETTSWAKKIRCSFYLFKCQWR